MLPFFIRHYASFVDRFFVFDDGSTDRSLSILSNLPNVTILPLEKSDPSSLSISLRDFFNEAWKQSRGVADWVVTTKIDEHFYHRDMKSYLTRCADEGVSCIPALGYQMMAETFPESRELLCETCTMGVPWRRMSKVGIFNPSLIEEMNFAPGRHTAEPLGQVVYPEDDELLMLHYKYLGIEYTHSRHEQCRPRQGNRDIENKWGHKWRWSKRELEADWADFQARVVDVAMPGSGHKNRHFEPRWWRI